MVSARSKAAEVFLSSDHKCDQISETEYLSFIERYEIDDEITIRIPFEEEDLNSGDEDKHVIPIDHFAYGLQIPIPWEMIEVMNYYGLVLAQIPPNSVGLMSVFINYLRSVKLKFTMSIFRGTFSVKVLKEGQNKEEFKGLLYLSGNGIKVLNLPNKIPLWTERYLIFEGDLGGLASRPSPRAEKIFRKEKFVSEEELAVLEWLAGKRFDLNHYLAIWPDVAAVLPEESKL